MEEDGINEHNDNGNRQGKERRGPRRSGVSIKPSYFLEKPIKPGDEVDVTIEAVAAKGDGIAKINGFVVFVKNAAKGEKVKVRITDVKTRFAIGEKIS